MAMGVKCITWVGNMFQKFEDICVDVDDTVLEVYLCHYLFLTMNMHVHSFKRGSWKDKLFPTGHAEYLL